jgi:hypothetical protein
MRICKVNKLWIPGFLLFYLASTTVSFVAHTPSLTHAFVAGSKSETFNKRLHVNRSWQKRFAEDAIALTGPDDEFSVPAFETKTSSTQTKQAIISPKASTPSRAPPAFV